MSIAHRAPTSSGPLSQTGCPAQAESGVESVIEKVTLLSDCGTWTRSTSGVNPSAAKPAALGCCTARAGYDESGFQRGPVWTLNSGRIPRSESVLGSKATKFDRVPEGVGDGWVPPPEPGANRKTVPDVPRLSGPPLYCVVP